MRYNSPVFAFCIAVLFLFGSDLHAQIEYPERSYETTVHQLVGFTNISIRYGRPMQRGRKIFGGLVPYEKTWRTGAGRTTKITFDKSLVIEGQRVDPGSYAFITIPGKEAWKIILHRDTTMFTQRNDYKTSDEVAVMSVKSNRANHHFEAFTIYMDIVNNDAVVYLAWDQTQVSFHVKTGTTSQVMNAIRSQMKSGSLMTNAEQMARAAEFMAFDYLHLNSAAKDSALTLIDNAIRLDEKAWMYRIKRSIYSQTKDEKGYYAAANEWVAYLEKRQQQGDQEEIALIRQEKYEK